MEDKNADYTEALVRACDESNGETWDLVVDHELRGVTVEMLEWFFPHCAEYYKMWCPDDHVSNTYEVPPTKESRIGSIRVIEERLGDSPVYKIRMRQEDPGKSPFGEAHAGAGWASTLGPDDQPVLCSTHKYEATPYGTKMRSTFRLPAKTPQWLINALRKHNQLEMGNLPNFLPELYRQNAGR